MTDNRTTELREKLTERGIKYRITEVYGMPVTLYENGGYTWSVTDHPNGYMIVNCGNLTPEQAIAATLGNGTLTAEQVREAVMSADRWDKPMGDTGLTNTHLIIRDDGWQAIADELNAELGSEINGDTSDGYHTFNELYHHRAVLFSVIARDHRELAWKARKHHDGTMYDGMFIVGIETPKGQATYHYDLDPYWEMFDCEEREYAPEWDGHTPDDAIERIAELGSGTCEYVIEDNMNETEGMGDVWFRCTNCNTTFDYYADDWLMKQNFCPHCGFGIRKAVKR